MSLDTHMWRGAIAFEGQETRDGRRIKPDALTWPRLPIPLFAPHGTTDPDRERIGLVIRIRRASGIIIGTGTIDGYAEGTILPCGIEVLTAITASATTELLTPKFVFTSGDIAALVLYADAAQAAWPEAQITVGPET